MRLINYLLLLVLSSCSISPFHASTTGRTFGQGSGQFEVGNFSSSYYLKFVHGLSDNFDVGYFIEFGDYTTSGINLKYSVVNNPQGYALAFELLYGGDGDNEYTSFGAINSYNLGNGVEFFVNTRVNKINADKSSFSLDKASGSIELKDYSTTYFYYAYGVNLWLTSNAGFSLYSSNFTGSGIKTKTGIIGGALLFNY